MEERAIQAEDDASVYLAQGRLLAAVCGYLLPAASGHWQSGQCLCSYLLQVYWYVTRSVKYISPSQMVQCF